MRALVAALESDNPAVQLAPLAEIRGIVRTYGGVELGAVELGHLRAGFLAVVRRLRAERAQVRDNFATWHSVLGAFQPTFVGLETIDLAFLNLSLDALCASS